MDDETLRLRCLEMAMEKSHDFQQAHKEAERMFAWIKRRGQFSFAGRVVGEGPKAKIVGTEGHLEPPFDDYLKE